MADPDHQARGHAAPPCRRRRIGLSRRRRRDRAIWKLPMRERDLDSNVIALAPGTAIGAHDGPDVDVLIYVLAGSGSLAPNLGYRVARRGALLAAAPLPARFTAGRDGLRYLTVHQRRQALTLLTTAPRPGDRRPPLPLRLPVRPASGGLRPLGELAPGAVPFAGDGAAFGADQMRQAHRVAALLVLRLSPRFIVVSSRLRWH